MTLSTTTNRVSYDGDSSTTSFPVPFYFLANSHIVVTHRTAAGVETTWVENTQYTLTGALSASGGTLTVDTEPTDYTPDTGETLVITRVVPLTQLTDYPEGGAFPATSHENALDKLTMLVQQLQEQVDRTLLFTVTAGISGLELPDPEADELLGWNAAATALENKGIGELGGNVLTTPLAVSLGGTGSATAADARTALAVPGTAVVNTFAATQSWTKGADVASAATLALGTDGNYFDITGSTGPVTAITVAAGTLFMLQFDSTPTLTHHATALNLPGGANIVAEAGDRLIGFATAANTVHVLAFVRASGVSVTGSMPRSYLAGLGTAHAADTDHDITVAVGAARDGGNTADMVLSSAITKRIDASWAVGTGSGGLDGTESVAGTPDVSTWYHVWLIKRPDTGVVDALFSESATAPTMPTNYTLKRRIGAVLTDGSANILAFSQLGDEFLWSDPPLDVSNATPGTSAVTPTMSTPLGIKTNVLINVQWTNTDAGFGVYISSPDVTDEAAAETTAPLATVMGQTWTAGAGIGGGPRSIRTNASSQIRYRAVADVAIYIATLGYIDRRGRDD